MKEKLKSTYFFSFIYSNLSLLVGHPADRMKTSLQITLNKPAVKIVKEVITSNYTNLFKGLPISLIRQNTKIIHRTLMMSIIPNYIDSYNYNPYSSSILKAISASFIDSIIVTPFENIKTLQMKNKSKMTILATSSYIYNTNNLSGFFIGFSSTMIKSIPSWVNLFLGYHMTKDKRDTNNILHTIGWATISSIPITLITTPIDVIKTQKQSLMISNNISIINSSKYIFNQYGLLSLWRGFFFRLLHKTLATATGYVIIDISNKFHTNS